MGSLSRGGAGGIWEVPRAEIYAMGDFATPQVLRHVFESGFEPSHIIYLRIRIQLYRVMSFLKDPRKKGLAYR